MIRDISDLIDQVYAILPFSDNAILNSRANSHYDIFIPNHHANYDKRPFVTLCKGLEYKRI
jgi:hypothetical protein